MAIKKTIEQNQKQLPNSDLLLTLQKALPQYFDRSGNFILDKFESELKENNIAEARDGYRLNFVGKDYARLQIGQSSETVIVPDSEHNNQPENINSENVFITGDNLEALRHLQNAYTGKIKMIYIDPPYNTGKEFVYNDRFEFNDDKLKTALGYGDAEIERLKSIQGKSSHSAWLTFIYPRLKLAQKLLTDDGVIFVSIDDNEQANLKLLLDDIFGEQNFVYQLSVVSKLNGNDNSSGMIETQEYCLIYAKNKNNFEIGVLPIEEENDDWKTDELGYWKEGGGIKATGVAARREDRPNLFFPIYINENNLEFSLQKDSNHTFELLPKMDSEDGRWTWQKIKFIKDANEVIVKKVKDGYSIYKKQRPQLGDIPSKRGKTTFYNSSYSTANSSAEIKNLFNGKKVFDFSKSSSLIKDLISLANTKTDSIILDFFAGSSTTAQSVMQLNVEDGGKRKFIMVQWPEITNPESEARKAEYNTIDEISRERIKRAAMQIKTQQEEARIKSEGQLFNNEELQFSDLGFKHYRLIEPAVKAIDKILEFNPNDTKLFELDMVSPFSYALTNTTGLDTILQTWLIQDGYDFNTHVEHLIVGKYQAQYVKQSAVLYLINNGFTHEALKDLLNKIGKYELVVNTVIVYPYSFSFEQMRELKNNLKNNLDQNITIIERY